MSFLSTIGKVISGVGGFLKSNSIGSQLAKTALYGLALSKVAKSIQKGQDTAAAADQGVQVSINPDPKNAIPVVYGNAYTSGIITDAHMPANNTSMWLCFTLSEMTGNLISGAASTIAFKEVYFNGLRLDFAADGYTVDKAYDDEGNTTDKFAGLIEVYPYVNGSSNPVSFDTEPLGNTTVAQTLFPTWANTDHMCSLVFALVRINYSPKNKISSVGDFKFNISNSMRLPGDVLNDYMTNTRYGAGIPTAEINAS